MLAMPKAAMSQLNTVSQMVGMIAFPVSLPQTQNGLAGTCESGDIRCDGRPPQVGLVPCDRVFRSRAALQAEILVLRHQVNVLRRKSPSALSSATSIGSFSLASMA